MLDFLRVSNLGVLTDAVIEPSPGLTVITGETGAGKTLLLGGLRLLRGEKADAASVGAGGERAQADGLFSSGREIGATRVVPREGKSRAHLEGSVVSAATLGDEIGRLVEIVGQHDQLRLTRPAEVLRLLDDALDTQGHRAREEYVEAWSDLGSVLKMQDTLGGDEMTLRRELDLTEHQASEIEGAALEPGEDESLGMESQGLRNAEETKESLAGALRALDRIVEDAGEVVAGARRAAELDSTTGGLAHDSETTLAQLSELRADVRAAAEELHSDEGRLEDVEARLTEIGDLKRKYGRSLGDVISFGTTARARSEELAGLLAGAAEMESTISAARGRVEAAAVDLSRARKRAATTLTTGANVHLGDLALGRGSVEFTMSPAEPGPSGSDRASVLFSSDDGLEPGPLASTASGGELSRVVLAVRLAARAPQAATLVFDEIDTGVGGATALAMGRKLAALAETVQVLCVTHLPQIAAFADTHYVVERENSTASVRRVESDERLREISRMLAGLPDSEAGHLAASELLAQAGS